MGEAFQPCVYILASQRGGTLYVGVTSDLVQRVWQHRNLKSASFAFRTRAFRLVHFEMFATMEQAISREKQLKRWHRQWKINLIEQDNSEWRDLAFTIGAGPVGLTMDAETSSA